MQNARAVLRTMRSGGAPGGGGAEAVKWEMREVRTPPSAAALPGTRCPSLANIALHYVTQHYPEHPVLHIKGHRGAPVRGAHPPALLAMALNLAPFRVDRSLVANFLGRGTLHAHVLVCCLVRCCSCARAVHPGVFRDSPTRAAPPATAGIMHACSRA